MYRSSQPGLGCPECALALELVEGEVPIFRCVRCGGAWIDAEASMAVLRGAADPSAVQRHSRPPAPRAGAERSRPCARCAEAMLPYPFGDVMLDTCPAHGTWFDHDEIERVVKVARAKGNEPASSLPSATDVWAVASFTAGVIAMPFNVLARALAAVVMGAGAAAIAKIERGDDDDY